MSRIIKKDMGLGAFKSRMRQLLTAAVIKNRVQKSKRLLVEQVIILEKFSLQMKKLSRKNLINKIIGSMHEQWKIPVFLQKSVKVYQESVLKAVLRSPNHTPF